MTEKKPEPKKIDNETLQKYMEQIVDQLILQASSRDTVTEIINEMHSKYGLKKPTIRKAASILYKRNKNEFEQDTEDIFEIIERCS